ncbi:MAG: biliverdin-producing heme oxygenase [Chitinophagaceae bacterium]
MLSTGLKERTKEAHQALEGIVIRQIKAIQNKEQYRALLYKFYGFHFPMEQLFDKYFTDEIVPSYSRRRRAGVITEDLTHLGGTSTNIPLATDLPVIDSLAKALGAFYVLEGSTQGGTIVANMLIKHVGLTPETTSFFSAYGDDKTLWASFREKLDSYPDDPSFQEEVIAAANDTFTALKNWMIV